MMIVLYYYSRSEELPGAEVFGKLKGHYDRRRASEFRV